jgi:transposase
VQAFEFFGGVFGTIRYDNLKAAATKTLRGRRREENERFVALRSHFEARRVLMRPAAGSAAHGALGRSLFRLAESSTVRRVRRLS